MRNNYWDKTDKLIICITDSVNENLINKYSKYLYGI